MGDTSATSGPNPSRERIVPPAKVSEHHRRGYIVPVGGAEDKDGNPTVLRRFVEVSGGEQARIAVIPPIRYRLWRYQLREDQLFLQRGFLVIRRTLIPLIRVQNVDTVQGPIARRFGLWSVVVFTAANAQSIPALSKSQADTLRESIAELARRARDEA